MRTCVPPKLHYLQDRCTVWNIKPGNTWGPWVPARTRSRLSPARGLHRSW